MSYLRLPIPSFLAPKQTIAKVGALEVIAAIPATRMAVIAPRRLKNNPMLKEVMQNSKRVDFKFFEATWKGEPSLNDLEENLAAIEDYRPDYITAIGGGRVLDGAKILWALYEHPNFSEQRLNIPFALPELRKKAKFCLVPTTAGTGSEASSSALFTDKKTGHKVPVVSHDFLPDLAILDPKLLLGLPKEQLCISALDALSHLIEGYTSKISNPISESLVASSVSQILLSLEALNSNPENIEQLLQLINGAYLAGIIQNTLLVGPVHAIAHQLGNTNIPHGLATGILLPITMKFMSEQNTQIQKKYDLLAKNIGMYDTSTLICRLKDIPSQYGVDSKLSQWPGVHNKKIQIGEAAKKDSLSRFFPIDITKDQLQELFERAW